MADCKPPTPPLSPHEEGENPNTKPLYVNVLKSKLHVLSKDPKNCRPFADSSQIAAWPTTRPSQDDGKHKIVFGSFNYPNVYIDDKHAAATPISQGYKLKPKSIHQAKPAVLFHKADKQSLVNNLPFVLVGKFSHGRPTFNSVKNFVAKLQLKKSVSLSICDSKHLFLECLDFEDFAKLWMKNVWSIDGYDMRMFKWSEHFHPSKESSISPVWIHLPGLPLYLFDELSLLSLGNVIGKPLKVDTANINRSKLGCASICVELDVSSPAIDMMWIEFVDDKEVGMGEGFWQKVVYGPIPSYCSGCAHLGHKSAICKRQKPGTLSVGTLDKHNKEQKIREIGTELKLIDSALLESNRAEAESEYTTEAATAAGSSQKLKQLDAAAGSDTGVFAEGVTGSVDKVREIAAEVDGGSAAGAGNAAGSAGYALIAGYAAGATGPAAMLAVGEVGYSAAGTGYAAGSGESAAGDGYAAGAAVHISRELMFLELGNNAESVQDINAISTLKLDQSLGTVAEVPATDPRELSAGYYGAEETAVPGESTTPKLLLGDLAEEEKEREEHIRIVTTEKEEKEPQLKIVDQLCPSEVKEFAIQEIENICATPNKVEPVFEDSPILSNQYILDKDGSPVLCSDVIGKSRRMFLLRHLVDRLKQERGTYALKNKDTYDKLVRLYTEETSLTIEEHQQGISFEDAINKAATSCTQNRNRTK